MSRVWPGITVVDANLSVHIASLRRALRDGQARQPLPGYDSRAGLSLCRANLDRRASLPPAAGVAAAVWNKIVELMRAMLTRLIGSADEVMSACVGACCSASDASLMNPLYERRRAPAERLQSSGSTLRRAYSAQRGR